MGSNGKIDNIRETCTSGYGVPNRNDEECYWVLYYTYLSSQEIGGVDEIMEKLSEMFRELFEKYLLL